MRSLAVAATIATLAGAPPVAAQWGSLGSIVVFDDGADGDLQPARVIGGEATGLQFPDAIVVDRQGRLYVTNRPMPQSDTVRVFGPDADGNVSPERVIAGANTHLDMPTALAIGRDDRLYVANGGAARRDLAPAITVYAPNAAGDVTPARILAGGLTGQDGFNPHRLVFGRRDSLFVKTSMCVAVYAPGATGASVPARLIFERVPRPPGGAYPTVRSPERFVLDSYDSMYVAKDDTVKVYAPGYDGTQPEVRLIAGPRAGINAASGIALDDRGFLYVADADSSLIKVFAPGATGDVAPVRRIGGPATRLFTPGNIAIDRQRRLYVTNVMARSVIRFVK
jgi:hypothetical protein